MKAFGLVLSRLTGTVPVLVDELEEVPFEATVALLERWVNTSSMITAAVTNASGSILSGQKKASVPASQMARKLGERENNISGTDLLS